MDPARANVELPVPRGGDRASHTHGPLIPGVACSSFCSASKLETTPKAILSQRQENLHPCHRPSPFAHAAVPCLRYSTRLDLVLYLCCHPGRERYLCVLCLGVITYWKLPARLQGSLCRVYLLASRTSMGTKRLAEKTLGMHAICKPIG